MKFLLSKGYTYLSSEESSEEPDETGNTQKILIRRPLPWLKKKYQKCFKDLDKLASSSLSAKSKHMTYRRRDGLQSERPMPADIPQQFVSSAYLLDQDDGDNDTSIDGSF